MFPFLGVCRLPGTWRDKGTLGNPSHRWLSPPYDPARWALWTITWSLGWEWELGMK